MKIKVRLFGDVAEEVGKKHELELEDHATILSLTKKIQEKSGKIRQGYLGRFKVGGENLTIMVNGKNISLINGLNTKLSDYDEVVIIPFVLGG